jgi:hypothetical protein
VCGLFFSIAIDCDVLQCGENEVCLEVDGLFQCVCHADYTGENCDQESKHNIMMIKYAISLYNIKYNPLT